MKTPPSSLEGALLDIDIRCGGGGGEENDSKTE